MADPTPEERAAKIKVGMFDCEADYDDSKEAIAAAIREAENAALERAAESLDRMGKMFKYNVDGQIAGAVTFIEVWPAAAIRALKR